MSIVDAVIDEWVYPWWRDTWAKSVLFIFVGGFTLACAFTFMWPFIIVFIGTQLIRQSSL